MMTLFDRLGDELNDIIGEHSNNNVGWAMKNLPGFDEGGLVSGDTSDDHPIYGAIKAVSNAANKTYNGRQDTSALGGNFINSPTYLTQHYAGFGKFFTGAPAGNEYTNHYKQPEKSNPVVSQTPTEFYAKWYNRLREFAQAQEVADLGQTKIKSV